MNEPTPPTTGGWASPISAADLLASSRSLNEPAFIDGQLYWLESQPDEEGRIALMRETAEGSVECLTPAPLNVRTRVHEYGGGAWAGSSSLIVFSNAENCAVMVLAGGATRELVNLPGWRFADFSLSPDGSWIAAVAEVHDPQRRQPENCVVRIDARSGAVARLADGADFYAAPRISPDGQRLVFISWQHPQMPWDVTTLQLAEVDGSKLTGSRAIATGASILEPCWGPDGQLCFATDASGYWNLATFDGAAVANAPEDPAEYAVPPWVFGNRSALPLGQDHFLAQRIEQGQAQLVQASLDAAAESLDLPWVAYGGLTANDSNSDEIAFIGARDVGFAELVVFDRKRHSWRVARSGGALDLDPKSWVSRAEPVEFPTADGTSAHGFFYAPRNPGHSTTGAERPPLVVLTHGGPTGMASAAFNARIQFYTSRGWAVLDVNYGGSTGFGRTYRERLRGRWGEVDVQDCVAGVQWLVSAGRIDGNRVAIRGGSAGGYTTLAALAFTDVFKAGASHYGIGDLGALARDTHKFESRYTDSLVAPWPAGEAIYRARSALFNPEGLNCPVIFFQGTEDRVVPPAQSEEMAAALRGRGVPVALVMFEGEGHGFRIPANAQQAIEQEFAFLCRAFGIPTADNYQLPPIDNEEALPPAGPERSATS